MVGHDGFHFSCISTSYTHALLRVYCEHRLLNVQYRRRGGHLRRRRQFLVFYDFSFSCVLLYNFGFCGTTCCPVNYRQT